MGHAAITAPLAFGRHLLEHRRAAAIVVAAAVGGAVVAAIVSGLLGGGAGTPAISGSPKAAVATVEAYSSALGRHDWSTICNKLYATAARTAAGGDACPAQLQQAAGAVTQPRLRILAVDVHPDGATVQVQAAVNNGPALRNTIQLVRQGGAYRIESSGGD